MPSCGSILVSIRFQRDHASTLCSSARSYRTTSDCPRSAATDRRYRAGHRRPRAVRLRLYAILAPMTPPRVSSPNSSIGERTRMKRGDFLSLKDLSSQQVEGLLDLALDLKARRRRGLSSELPGKSVAMLFQKRSLRTRTSFDVGLYEMGGHAVYLGPDEVAMGKRESIPDVARVLSRYVHGIVARTNRHQDQVTLAEFASVPVINALSDYEHPCQAVADLVTMRECFGNLRGLRVAYVGDGNNMARSLAFASAKVGLELTIASPTNYEC